MTKTLIVELVDPIDEVAILDDLKRRTVAAFQEIGPAAVAHLSEAVAPRGNAQPLVARRGPLEREVGEDGAAVLDQDQTRAIVTELAGGFTYQISSSDLALSVYGPKRAHEIVENGTIHYAARPFASVGAAGLVPIAMQLTRQHFGPSLGNSR